MSIREIRAITEGLEIFYPLCQRLEDNGYAVDYTGRCTRRTERGWEAEVSERAYRPQLAAANALAPAWERTKHKLAEAAYLILVEVPEIAVMHMAGEQTLLERWTNFEMGQQRMSELYQSVLNNRDTSLTGGSSIVNLKLQCKMDGIVPPAYIYFHENGRISFMTPYLFLALIQIGRIGPLIDKVKALCGELLITCGVQSL